jgi:putative addiction module component (TIGR02574 family)
VRAEDTLPQALELSSDERTRLAVLLMESVEPGDDEGEVEGAWLDEITRRLDEHEQGRSRAIPADAALAEAWNRVKRARG